MHTALTAGLTPSRPLLGALSSTTLIIEIVVAVIVVALIVAIVIINQRNKHPKSAAAPAPQSYYADLQQPGQAGGLGGQPQQAFDPAGQSDPFAGFAGGGAPGGGAPAAPAPAAPAAGGGNPPPGTPAGWLPDPGGAPDTLRYWDGAVWTQHVAARS
jgi:hypothetical protein